MTADRSRLRVVSDENSQVKPRRPKTVAQAVRSGDRREVLLALQARVAKAIDSPKTPAAFIR
jgi:hypothetical protein